MTHHLKLTIAHERLFHEFTCDAPVGAQCRLICPDEWDYDDHEHELVDGGECLLCVYMDNDDATIDELYDGEEQPFRPGPVVLAYQDEGVTWHYETVAETLARAFDDAQAKAWATRGQE